MINFMEHLPHSEAGLVDATWALMVLSASASANASANKDIG